MLERKRKRESGKKTKTKTKKEIIITILEEWMRKKYIYSIKSERVSEWALKYGEFILLYKYIQYKSKLEREREKRKKKREIRENIIINTF